ncbi:MAG: hypothetical protein IPH88_14225 [Bacteroidales bacterium]|nr:hypothetical protein [Bacteroidales bacterium]
MRKLILTIILSLIMLESFTQEIKVKGTLVFFYTKRVPVVFIDPPIMYCLDSIRLITRNKAVPVLGDLVQNEYFSHEGPQKFTANIYTNAVRSTVLYCENPGTNHIHTGGAIFERKDLPDKLFICFNINAKAYKVVSTQKNENDSIYSIRKRSNSEFIISENEQPCDFFINTHDYLIITELTKTMALTKRQQAKYKFQKSKVSEFWRYGLW